jgi:hypothetical protein
MLPALFAVLWKELRDSSRDRRAITTILMSALI